MQTVKNRTVFCSPVLWASNINSLFSKQSLKGHPLHAYSSASEARRHKLNNDAGLSSVSLSLSESSQSCLTLCNHGLYSPWNSPGKNTGALSLLQGIPYLEPVCCSMSSSNCCFLTWYRFLRRQVRWSGIPFLWEFLTVCCDPHSQRLWHSR